MKAQVTLDAEYLRDLRDAFASIIDDVHGEHTARNLKDCTVCQGHMLKLRTLDEVLPMSEPEQDGTIITVGPKVFLRSATSRSTDESDPIGIWYEAVLDSEGCRWDTITALARRVQEEIKVLRYGWS